MTAFHLVKSSVSELTLEAAMKMRDMEPSPTERDIDPKRIKYLTEKAEAGKLVPFHWAIATCAGKTLRMNGQHSSTMLCNLDGKFPQGGKVHLDEYAVDSPEGLADLFRQFDARKSGRSAADVSGAFQGLYEPLREVPKASAKLALEGVCWFRRHVEGVPVPSGDDAYSLFNEPGLHAFIRFIGELFSIKTPELQSVPIVAATYATFITSETAAREFWEEVARGGKQYEDTAPTSVLDTWLKDLKEDKDEVRSLALKPANFYQGCIYAWNAHREEKSIKDIKYDVKKGFHKIVG